jgi:hypothetical protein
MIVGGVSGEGDALPWPLPLEILIIKMRAQVLVHSSLERLQRKQRALDPHGILVQRDADQVEHVVLSERSHFVERPTFDLVGQRRSAATPTPG